MGTCWYYKSLFCPSDSGCHYLMHCDLSADPPFPTRKVLYDCSDSDATHFTAESSASMFFQCGRCRQIKPYKKDEGLVGYAINVSDDSLMCGDCCGQTDRLHMLGHDRITLYLVKRGVDWVVTNWCGTLNYVAAYVRTLKHPFAPGRIAYFTADGRDWSAKNIGDTQIAHCRKLKAKP